MTALFLNKIDFSALDWKKLLLLAFILSLAAAIVLTVRYVNRKYLSDDTEQNGKKEKKK